MQAIENWSDISGRVIDVADDPVRSGFRQVKLEVDSVEAVAGFANLLGDVAGSQITVSVRADPQTGLSPGNPVRLRVRRASPSLIISQ